MKTIDEKRRQNLAKKVIDAVRVISQHGTDDDVNVMYKLMLQTPEAEARIRKEFSGREMSRQEISDAALQVIVVLANDILSKKR
jgi:hypothetical protein